MDAERKGGIHMSTGDMGIVENPRDEAEVEGGVETVMDVGSSSLETFVSCGAMTGERKDICPGWDGGTVGVHVGVGQRWTQGRWWKPHPY